MLPKNAAVAVVDDDEDSRASVCALVQSMGLPSKGYASAEQFLGEHELNQAGCLVADVRMGGISGLELQEKLKENDVSMPVIIMTAFARTPITVRAMQNGAVTVLEKPYREDELWDAIGKALALDDKRRSERDQRQRVRQRIAELTQIQYRVMEMIVAGQANKAIATTLDISVRTVESRRREVFTKMQAGSIAELVRMLSEAEALD